MSIVATLILISSFIDIPVSSILKNDNSLVAPGAGAERILLNEKAGALIEFIGRPENVSEFNEKKELFKDVFELESPKKIYFNKLFFFKSLEAVALLHNDSVSGIIGLSCSRITADSADLKKGVEYFIFSYGNEGLIILTGKNQNKKDKIFLYKNLGIALADDGGDNLIDFYIVFPGEQVF